MDLFNQLILVISVTSFLSFQWLFHRVSPWVSTRVSPGFLRLADKQKVEWNSRTVSTLHALVVGLFCLYILLFDDAINEDPVWGDPTLVKINVGVTTGYLISGENRHFSRIHTCKGPRSLPDILAIPSHTSATLDITRQCILLLLRCIYNHFCSAAVICSVYSCVVLFVCLPDLLLIFYYWKAIGDKFFVVHHLAALYAYYYVLLRLPRLSWQRALESN
ncbi:TLC domain-containing protein 4-B isoform X3 [Coregonus clupeaformis]|uniref:TLC domain-containing protein 4-B isoform X3 n=1 Tax=Coregonus clupeaformis TaxID=59861 RepID=UPI001BDFD29C|nr:TLC domain-containing protein 4-B isoform X3 [Coregonus clupeaformis]